MSRYYSLSELKGSDLWLLRTLLLLFFFVSACFSLAGLARGETHIKGQPAPIRHTSEPVRYWFFTSLTMLPAIASGTGLVLSFTAAGKPVKRRAK
jgi:hypothetical protein